VHRTNEGIPARWVPSRYRQQEISSPAMEPKLRSVNLLKKQQYFADQPLREAPLIPT